MSKFSNTHRNRIVDSAEVYRRALRLSILILAAGVSLLGVGIYASLQPAFPATRLVDGETVAVSPTPWFKPGLTIFAEVGTSMDSATDTSINWGCISEHEEGLRPLTRVPDPATLGSRVMDGASLTPVIDIGRIKEGTKVGCNSHRPDAHLWLMETDPSPSRTPLALFIAGIAALGIGAACHPHGRGIEPLGGRSVTKRRVGPLAPDQRQ